MQRLFFLLAALTCTAISTAQGEYASSAYYESWAQFRQGPAKCNPSTMASSIGELSFFNYAFALFNYDAVTGQVTNDWKIYFSESQDADQIDQCVQWKKTYPNLKVILSVGGQKFNNPQDPVYGRHTYRFFSEMTSNPDRRAAFIESAKDICTKYDLDGLDFDWGYAGCANFGGNTKDYTHFLIFLQEFKEKNPDLLLSIAMPHKMNPSAAQGSYHFEGEKYKISPLDPSSYFAWLRCCSEVVDHINLKTYDYTVPIWSGGYTGDNAPLYHPQKGACLSQTIELCKDAQIDLKKIIAGVPAYGRNFGVVTYETSDGRNDPYLVPGHTGAWSQDPGLLAYFEIEEQLQAEDPFYKDVTYSAEYGATSALAPQSHEWLSFDTPLSEKQPSSIESKVAYLKSQGVKGVFVWAISLDYFQSEKPAENFPIMKTVYQSLKD